MYLRFLIYFVFTIISVITQGQSRSLEYYLNEGILNSPLLKDINNQASSAIVDSLIIRSKGLPQVEAKSQLMYSPAYRNFGYDEVVTDGGNYQAVVGITQNILNRKQLGNKFKAAGILRQSATNSSKITVADLRKIITGQYLAAYADFSDLTFNKSFLDLSYKEEEITRHFVTSGLYKQTDYLSLHVETQSLEILVNQLKNQYQKDLRLLIRLCGLDDTTLVDLEKPVIEIRGKGEIIKSPLFIQYKIDSLQIANEKEAVDISYKLKLNWFADAGFLTSTPWNFYNHFGYSAGISLSIPVYDGRQKEKEKQKLDLAEQTRWSYQDNFKKQFNQQVIQLNDELNTLQALTLQLENQLATSEELVNALRQQLEAGIIRMTEYINSIKNYRYITRNLNENRVQIQLVTNELNYLLSQ